MATRDERISRAKDIVARDPNITKRRLEARLVKKYGVGLSDTMRRQIIAQANTPHFLRHRLNTPAFTRHERLVLKKALHRIGNTSYVIQTINDRFTDAREAHAQGLTRRQFMVRVRYIAREQGFLADRTTRTRKQPDGAVKGQVDFYRILRYHRDRDIERGDYVPKPKPKPRTDKGDIKAQKIRYQDRQSTLASKRWLERQTALIQNWIKQKEKAIAVTKDEIRRAQLTAELGNLQAMLERLK